MKYLLLISFLILFVMVAYRYSVHRPNSPQTPIRAVYLVRGQGQIDQGDLDRHPEVKVTDSFITFRQYAARHEVALWIDGKALEELSRFEKEWFKSSPQTYYPMVVVGYGDKLFPFDSINGLGLCCNLGPGPLAKGYGSTPGFSVHQSNRSKPERVRFWEGYATEQVRIEDILTVTNSLLDEKLPPEPEEILSFPLPTTPESF